MAGFPARRRAAEALAEAERLRLAVAKATGKDPAEQPPVSDEPLTLAEAIRIASREARGSAGRDALSAVELALNLQGIVPGRAAGPVATPEDALAERLAAELSKG